MGSSKKLAKKEKKLKGKKVNLATPAGATKEEKLTPFREELMPKSKSMRDEHVSVKEEVCPPPTPSDVSVDFSSPPQKRKRAKHVKGPTATPVEAIGDLADYVNNVE